MFFFFSLLFFVSCVSSEHCRTRKYPLFKQCDSKWGSHEIGTSSKTICNVGCLISSISMSLNGRNKTIDHHHADPGTLNTWLTSHHGYVYGDNYVWASIDEKFGYVFEGFEKKKDEITKYVCSDKHVVTLNVHEGEHWVLAIGVNSEGYEVNDPGFLTTEYKFDQVVQAGVYSIKN